MLEKILKQAQERMDKMVGVLVDDIKNIHTGRASSSLVEDIKVNHYNSLMPLKQIASITSPDPNLIIISPWDKGALLPIETAIKESKLNVSPVNDGKMIRISLPPMSEERRKEYVKIIHEKAEQARIGIRTLREDSWKQVKQLEKEKALTEDDRYMGEEKLNKLTSIINTRIEEIIKDKEKEIMTL